MNIHGIDFNKNFSKVGTAIGNQIVQVIPDNVNISEFINSQNYYKLLNAIDIDWCDAQLTQDIQITHTSDLLLVIKNLLTEVNALKEKTLELELKLNENKVIDADYSTDENGFVNIINPNNE